ncbi:ArdC family protein [Fusibacillus kribbianus]|uniref:Zincin-like metallopeptidase domain-containing protein n=1 Tax=Fusibacillus kribbianus TaxID=3044208 RepID=A0AAP4B9A9_9FIRM|nr:zincin-like metallopeptidase domain-containing protein [Ruminococcus sp. YH-rum2234]MDI9241910.1 zincin-like metallopeptidase domain-containing protein [Ruminococcus sp. YH-rum2234]
MSVYEELNHDRKALVDQVVSLMETEGLTWKRGWSTAGVNRPYNPVSGTYYKAGNVIRLMIQSYLKGYTDNRWMTFNHAKSKGWSVKKGEKGIRLEKWIFEERKKVQDEKTGEIHYEIKKLDSPKVNLFYVFNAEQISGIPELQRKTYEHTNEELKQLSYDFMKSAEVEIEYTDGDEAFYRPSEDKIYLPKEKYFETTGEFLATGIHEMAHSTGHPSRLNRLSDDRSIENYAREELVAEFSAVFVQADLGVTVPEGLQNNSAYIKSWIQMLTDDPNALFRACREADRSSERLMKNYEAYMDRIQTAAIEKDLRSNGYQPTDQLIKDIKDYAAMTGEACIVEGMLKQLEDQSYSEEQGKYLAGIINQLADQELTASTPEADIERVQDPVPEVD